MSTLSLEFSNRLSPELIQTRFSHPLLGAPHYCVRGKTAGAYVDYGSFQWTSAVKALALLVVRTAQTSNSQDRGIISGEKGSLASSLDYSLDKECLWLSDMFGTDSHGRLLARRILLRSNPGRKRAGPVSLSINGSFLPKESLEIRWDGVAINSLAELEELARKIADCQTAPSVLAAEALAA